MVVSHPSARRQSLCLQVNSLRTAWAISGLPPRPSQIDQVSPGSHGEGSGLVDGSFEKHPEYQAEVTTTQFVFSTIYVTQTALATVCPSVQESSTAQSRVPSSSVQPVYF